MTNYPFEINGEDFSDIVHKRGYLTDRQPVYTAKITDLDQVDDYKIARYRGFLDIPTNDLKAERAAQLAAQLMKPPLRIGYWCLQLGKKVEETMTLEKMPQQLKMQTPRADWIAAMMLNFREV